MARRASSSDRACSHGGSSDIVVVVDDDAAMCEVLQNLIRSVGLKVEAFGSIADFLVRTDPDNTSCLVLDVRPPGRNRLDCHDELRRANVTVPVVSITGYGDIAMSVRAIKAGAVEFLPKPFRDRELLDAIQLGIEQGRERRAKRRAAAALQATYATLTSRERDIFEPGVSEVMVKGPQEPVMHKMNAKTLVELVQMDDALQGAQS